MCDDCKSTLCIYSRDPIYRYIANFKCQEYEFKSMVAQYVKQIGCRARGFVHVTRMQPERYLILLLVRFDRIVCRNMRVVDMNRLLTCTIIFNTCYAIGNVNYLTRCEQDNFASRNQAYLQQVFLSNNHCVVHLLKLHLA